MGRARHHRLLAILSIVAATRTGAAQGIATAVEAAVRGGYADLTSSSSDVLRENPFLSGTTGGGGANLAASLLYRGARAGIGLGFEHRFLGRSSALTSSSLVPPVVDPGGYYAQDGTRSLWNVEVFGRLYSSSESTVQVFGQVGLGAGVYRFGADYLGTVTHAVLRPSVGIGLSARVPLPSDNIELHLGPVANAGWLFPVASSYQREDLGESTPQASERWCPQRVGDVPGTVGQCTSGSTGINTSFDLSIGLEARVAFVLRRPPQREYLRMAVDLTFRANDRQPEIERSVDWQSLTEAGAIRHVALQAPDNCEDNAASTTRGRDQGAGEILHTRCEIWMSEFERRLVHQGYTVTGWTAVARHVDRYHVTPVEAARYFGAQVLFQVNSLERVRARLDQDIEWRYRYFRSNVFGEVEEPAPLTGYERDSLRARSEDLEDAILQRSFLGVTMNVSTLHVPTGRGIWYFHWDRFRHTRSGDRDFMVFSRLPGEEWSPFTPRQRPRVARAEDLRTEDRRDVTHRANADLGDSAQHFGLVREMIDAFVQRFAFERRVVGEPLPGSPPPPVPPPLVPLPPADRVEPRAPSAPEVRAPEPPPAPVAPPPSVEQAPAPPDPAPEPPRGRHHRRRRDR